VFAYVIALMINQFGNAFTGNVNILGLIVAIALLVGIIYMLFRPYKEATTLSSKEANVGSK
jgi:ferrous iron transport protein B